MYVLGVIPARYASTRFPGKPLALVGGKTMISRVLSRASQASSLAAVVVATDDERIFNHVMQEGGRAMMTEATHASGTSRCAEVAARWRQLGPAPDLVVNIQGDEPFIHPGQIDLLVSSFSDPATGIATLARVITDRADLFNENVVKVVTGTNGQALYFSRSAVPFVRNADPELWTEKHQYLKHIGIYAYRLPVLQRLASLTPTPLETAESLEQLRWLEHGIAIRVALTEVESAAVDTPADLEKINNSLG